MGGTLSPLVCIVLVLWGWVGPAQSRQGRRFDDKHLPRVLMPPGHPYLSKGDHRQKYICPDMTRGIWAKGNRSATIPKVKPYAEMPGWGPTTSISCYYPDNICRDIKNYGGFALDNVMFTILAFRTFLSPTAPLPWSSDPEKRPLLLDLGGNVGVYSTCVMWNGIHTISVEANPAVAHILQANTDFVLSQSPTTDRGGSMIFGTAVSTEDGPPLCFIQDPANLGGSHIRRAREGMRRCDFHVPVTTVSRVFDAAVKTGLWTRQMFKRLFYLKIDIEQMEYEALKGGKSVLEGPNRPCMGQFELEFDHTHLTYPAIRLMRQYGYCMEELDKLVKQSQHQGMDSIPERILATKKPCKRYPTFVEMRDLRVGTTNQYGQYMQGKKVVDVFFYLTGKEFEDCLARVTNGMGQ